MLTTDENKVRAVSAAYIRVIKQVFNQFTKPPIPSNGKHFDNCLRFFESAQEFGASLESLMLACLEHFPPYWCQKIFKRKFPNVMILVSEKSRNRGLKDFPRRAAQDKPDKLPQLYANQLKGFPPHIAEGLLNEGFLGGDGELRGQVWKILQKEWADAKTG